MSQAKYHIITFGCQMNKSDSERIRALLGGVGMEEVGRPDEADLILMNSCSVRQSAEDRIFGQVNGFAKLRARNPKLVIAVTGCMAGRDKDGALRRKLPEVDLFFPTADMVRLPQRLAELGLIEQVGDSVEDYLKIAPNYSSVRQAFVPIQTGCSNFCTYCVVPAARGLEKNRLAADILEEIRDLAGQGMIEVTLLGQTVNSYHAEDSEVFSSDNPYSDHFAALLWEINRVEGIERIHYTAPHPQHMTDEVIDALALPKHVNYLHLPVQSGSDAMLTKMNRKYTRDEYLDVIRRIKRRIPGIALGTDIIVGFCGETEEMFEETVSLYREVDFDIGYIAMYSPRTGTPAWQAFKDDVSRTEKKRRWKHLHDIMEEIVCEKNRKYVGQTVEVLVESCKKGICVGNSREMKQVRFPGGPELIGRFVPVRISKALAWALDGEAVVEKTAE
ncbi:MAG: tRNA (N6-isopentenyl adenosine(37)-C2)-methylthiotransferase MiaB [Patescibacteria group bacterium]|nr:tRNA (N6-isopentenyl adenosine(37)-C2)-methylthiotransferase MiaB [Patescibacteria group bacterium]